MKTETFCSNLKAKEIGILQIKRDHYILGMSRCCIIWRFCMPVKWDLSMTISPAKSLAVSFVEEFLSEVEPSIIKTRTLIGPEWMKEIGGETSGWTDAFETEKCVVFIDLPLTMTTECDLSVLNCRPGQFRAVMHQESKVWAPETLVDIRLSHLWKQVVRAMWYCWW